jgi:hypothetical protein
MKWRDGKIEQRGQRRMVVRANNATQRDAPLPTLQVIAPAPAIASLRSGYCLLSS